MIDDLIIKYRSIANFLNKISVKRIIEKNPDAILYCDYYKGIVTVHLTVYLKDNDYPVEEIATDIVLNCYNYYLVKDLLSLKSGRITLRIALTKDLDPEEIDLLRKIGKIKDEVNSYVCCEVD